jgi:hypothetical protein
MGGAWTNINSGLNKETGWCSPPHFHGKEVKKGAQVFVFFEAGDPNKPVYFASAQSGEGWFSEHPNQHVFHSDNIRVRIDEDPAHPDSTCQFDSYNQENCEFSINDGTKVQTQTRLDIEILAKDINAVNIQIHGDVNMKVLGDWYVHHEGNKHETHIGTHYIRHVGDTVISEEGSTIIKKEGDLQRYLDGQYTDVVTQNYTETIQQDFSQNILGRRTEKTGQNTDQFYGGDVETTIQKGEVKRVLESAQYFVGQDKTLTVVGKIFATVGNTCEYNVNDNIAWVTKTGNIDLTTLGEFEIVDGNGNITANGYKNIGTRGNIRLTSTFGNIGLKTKEDKSLADLEKEFCCVAWNPGYLKQMGLIAQILPGIDETTILQPVTPPTDIVGFFNFLLKAAVYDGFPTFLPCKMIMQNPNIDPPEEPWIQNFRTIDDYWDEITNVKYWKLISRAVGNIDLRSWSGDISLVTQGTLGNAGNINLIAKNKYGGLPGYDCATIKEITDTPFRIYTDPRDLFLDTHIGKITTGTFSWFSSSQGAPQSAPPAIVQKPLNPVQAILSLLGIPFQFGFSNTDSGGGGCMECITDVITQTAVDLGAFSILPWVIAEAIFLAEPPHHKFNGAYGSLMHKGDCCAGSVSLLKGESNGYGHAVDKCGLDEIYGGTDYHMGNIITQGVGSWDVAVGKNAQITTKTNDWKFGVNTKINTGFIPPSKGITPIEAILGELNIAVPGQVCEPIVKTATRKYFNQFDGKTFGNYTSIFLGFPETGVYMLPLLPIGSFGFDISLYTVNVPSLYFVLGGFKLQISKLFNPDLQPYTINRDVLAACIRNISCICADVVSPKYIEVSSTDEEPAEQSSGEDSEPMAMSRMLLRSVPAFYNESGGAEGEESPEDEMGDDSDYANEEGWELEETEEEKFERECKEAEENADKLVKMLNNSWKIKFGFDGLQTTISGCAQFTKLSQQLPNTAAAVSLAVPVVSVLGKLIPGIGEFVQQAAKMLPHMVVPEYHDTYFNTDYGLNFYNRSDYKAWMPTKTLVSGGLISWPSGKPILYNIDKMALPDIAGIADGLLSVGSVMDPIGTVTKLFTEQLPNAIGQTEANATVGVAMPKPAADALSMQDIASGSFGLYPGVILGGTVNVFDSEKDKKGAFADVKVKLPLAPPFTWNLSADAYLIKTGVKGNLTFPLLCPIPDGEVTVDILDESFAMTVGGINPPRWILKVARKNCF